MRVSGERLGFIGIAARRADRNGHLRTGGDRTGSSFLPHSRHEEGPFAAGRLPFPGFAVRPGPRFAEGPINLIVVDSDDFIWPTTIGLGVVTESPDERIEVNFPALDGPSLTAVPDDDKNSVVGRRRPQIAPANLLGNGLFQLYEGPAAAGLISIGSRLTPGTTAATSMRLSSCTTGSRRME